MKNIKHSVAERNSLKIRALMQEVGVKGYGMFWYFLEEIYEGKLLRLNDGFYNLYSVVFKLSTEEVKKVILALLKHDIFLDVENTLCLREFQEIKEKRSLVGAKGAEARWKKIAEEVLEVKEEIKPEQQPKDKLEELIKNAVAKTPIKTYVPEVLEVKKPVKRKVPKTKTNPLEVQVSQTDFDSLDKMEIKTPLKEWEFLPLFNELKLQFKPTSKGHQTLTPTDKTNLKRLINNGYSKEEFTRVIVTALSNSYVQTQGLDFPNHVLRNDNFERYLNKSEKPINTFVAKESEQPKYK